MSRHSDYQEALWNAAVMRNKPKHKVVLTLLGVIMYLLPIGAGILIATKGCTN